MTWQPLLYFCSILLTGGLTGFLAWYAWRQPALPGIRPFGLLALVECLLAGTEILSMLGGTQAQAYFWFNLRFIFTAILPIFWLMFALEYYGRRNWLSKRLLAGMFIIPLITQIMIWTNSRHGLWVIQDVGFHQSGPFWIAVTGQRMIGLWFLVHSFYSLSLLLAGVGVILFAAWNRRRLHRGQALLLLIGAVSALITTLIPIFNLLPHSEFNPFIPGIGIAALFYALAIFRFQLLKRPPTLEPASPFTQLEPGEKSSLAVFIFIFILFVSGLAASGYLAYQNYEKQFRAQVESEISAIAELKVDELQDWRRGRLADAEILYKNPVLAALAERYFDNPADHETEDQLLAWLVSYRSYLEYDRVRLMDTQGVTYVSDPGGLPPISHEILGQIPGALISGQITMVDFHRREEDRNIYLTILIPIVDGSAGDQIIGLISLSIDPEIYLYPFIENWPSPRQSAETLLIRRDGEDALFLNPLRYAADAALTLRFPLADAQSPAVMAALGRTGIVEGVDYRGQQVVADIRPVPDSPWFLVAKMDTAEVYAPLRERLWQMFFFFGLLAVACGTGLILIWRQQRMRDYQMQVRTLEALRLSEEKFKLAFDTSPDAVTITRLADGTFVSVNKGFEQLSGYTREQTVGKTSLEINIWKNPQDRRNVVEALRAEGEVKNYEAPFLTRDGEIHGLMSAALIQVNGEPHILNITRDITGRKQAEAEMQAAFRRFQIILSSLYGGILVVNNDGRVEFANRSFCELFNLEHGPESLIGLKAPEIIQMIANVYADPPRALARFQEIMDQGQPLRDEEIAIAGGRMYIRDYIPIVVDGRQYGRLWHHLDITGRKQAEAELKESREQFATAFFTSPVAQSIITQKDNEILAVNDACCRLFEYDREELVGASTAKLKLWQDPASRQNAVEELQKTGRLLPREATVRVKSGAERIVIFALEPISWEGASCFISSVFDITDRKRAEELLRENDARLRLALKAAKAGAWEWNLQTNENIWSEELWHVYGLEPHSTEPSYEAWLATVHLDDREKAAQTVQEAAASETELNVEWRVVDADGTQRWLMSRGQPFRDSAGKVVRFIGTVLDITGRKQAEATLQESETNLRSLIENTDGSIWAADSHYGLIVGNAEFHRNVSAVLGHRLEMGESLLLPVFPPEANAEWRSYYERALQDEHFTIETLTRFRESPHYMEYRFSPIREDNGEIRGVTVFGRDITERKLAEEALRTSEEKWRGLFEILPVGVSIVDSNHLASDTNPALAQILELTPEGLLNGEYTRRKYFRSDFTLMAPEEYPSVRAVKEQKIIRNVEIGVEKEDGAIIWTSVSATPLFSGTSSVTVTADITERKRAEMALSENERAKTELLEKLNDAQHFASIGSWEWDLSNEHVWWSDETYHIFGVRPGVFTPSFEANGKFVHPDDFERYGQVFEHSLQSGEPLALDIRLVTDDGTLKYCDVKGKVIYGDSGQPLRFLGTIMDITERKLVEQALYENENKYRTLVQNMQVGMVAHGPDTSVLFSNSMASQLLGLSLDQMLGKTAVDPAWHFVQEDGTRMPLDEYPVNRALAANQPVRNLVLGIIHPDREIPTWVQCDAYQVQDVDGKVQQVVVTFLDVSERKRAEDALRVSEQKFRQAFDTSPIAISISRIKGGGFVSVNRSFERFTGYSEAEVLGKTAEELNFWRSPEVHQALISDLRNKGEMRDYETAILTRRGEIYCLMSASIIDINGEPHILTMTVDITERKQAEDALRKSQMQLQAIMDYSPALISIKDLDGNIILANRSLSILDAPPLNELIGRSVFDIFPREVAEALWNNDLAALQANAPLQSEEVVRHKDGAWHTYWTVKFPIYLQSDQPFGICAISNDITERKQAEDALRESEAFITTVLDNLPVGIAVNSVDPAVTFNYMNDNFPKFYRTTREKLADPDIFWNAVYEDAAFRETIKKRILDDLASGDPERMVWMDVPITRKGESISFITARNIPIPGKPLMISTIWDVTERKQAQEQLLRTLEELRRSNTELEQFAYVASHDLQEPLRAVAGMVQLLQQRYKGQLDVRADEYIGLAVEGATRMQTLINDLLAYSRVERRGSPIKPVDANEALVSALRNLGTAIREQGATITNGDLPTLDADATQLAQVFQNLIGNAIKFHSERPPQIRVEARDIGEAWQFSVSDNGIGIEPQYYERIFLVFQRLHTRRDYPGTGIGLSICKKIVERHGGRIWIESTPGQGTTFHFTIPHRR
jgi:PAS domain S-box-containing protein